MAHILRVELDDVGYMDVQFVGGNFRDGFSCGGLGRWHKDWQISIFGISGAKPLTYLVHVDF